MENIIIMEKQKYFFIITFGTTLENIISIILYYYIL
jgi:hypothetical protein